MLRKGNVAVPPGLRMLGTALLRWGLAASALLVLASLVLAGSGTGSELLGYVSSAISFLAAVCAGTAVERNEKGVFPKAVLTAGALIVALLTVGVLIGRSGVDASGVLSVVTFTISGVLLGAALAGAGRMRGGRRQGRSVLHRRST